MPWTELCIGIWSRWKNRQAWRVPCIQQAMYRAVDWQDAHLVFNALRDAAPNERGVRVESAIFLVVYFRISFCFSVCVCVWCRLLVSRPFHVSCLCSLRVRPFADAGQIKKVPRRSATRQLFWHSYSSPVAPFPVVVIRPQNDTWLASFLFFFFILIFIYLFTFLTPPLSSRSARAHPLSAMCDVCVHSHSRRYDFAFDSNTERNQAKLRRGFLF